MVEVQDIFRYSAMNTANHTSYLYPTLKPCPLYQSVNPTKKASPSAAKAVQKGSLFDIIVALRSVLYSFLAKVAFLPLSFTLNYAICL